MRYRGDPWRRRWLLLGILAASFLLVNVYRLSTGVLTEQLMAAFRTTGAELGTLHAMFFLVYAVMQIPTGILVDRIGPRRTAAGGTAIMNVGALWFTLASSFHAALGARFLIGLGGSVIFVSMLRFAASWYTPAEFPTVNGLCFAVGGLGGILATAPFAVAVDIAGWERTMQALAVGGLLTAIVIAGVVRDTPTRAGYDPIHPDAREGPRLSMGEVRRGLGRVLVDPWVWVVCLILFAAGGINLTVFGLWGIPYVVQVYDTSVLFASVFTMIGGVGAVLGPPVIGWIASHTGRRTSIVVAGGVIYVGCLSSIAVLGDPPIILVGLTFLLIGALIGAFVVTYPLIKERHPSRLSGIALGSINGSSFFGAAVFPTLMGFALDAYWTGETVRGARVYSETGYRVSFAIATAISVVALVAALWLHRAARREGEPESAREDTSGRPEQ